MEKEGYVERIIFQNEENGYTVAEVETFDGDEVFVGYLQGIEQGMYITAEGEEVDHQQYDIQFKVDTYRLEMPDDLEGMCTYLGSGVIKGVGTVMAGKIVRKFKKDTFRIIEEEPERLAEIKGISERKAREIAIQFREKQDLRDAIVYLSKFGMNAKMAVRVYEEYGDKMKDVLSTNPYRLAEDIENIGFKTADAIAMKAGIGIDSDFRIRAAVLYVLSQSMGLGHMYLPSEMLINKTISLLSESQEYQAVTEASVNNQLMALGFEQKIIQKEIDGEKVIYASSNYFTELSAARLLLELNITESIPANDILTIVKKIEETENITLDAAQEDTVVKAAIHGVSVITGGPGTGKTTTMNVIIKYFESQKMDILLAAPTGRAAKRIYEATGYEAQTIHRMLELSGGALDEGRRVHFERNASNPLEADVVIVDEVSMVDTFLLQALVSAMVPGMHLVLIGDVDQLPSVGAGEVLKDIIASDVFAVSFLKNIYRQQQGSDIVMNAHKINRGEPLVIDNKSNDFFFLKRETTKAVIKETCELIKENLPGYLGVDASDIQVLSPMRKGDLGIETLNPILQKLLNPPDGKKMEREVHDVIFREGDKVMQTKNNYKLEWTVYSKRGHFEAKTGVGVFNGDMGIIETINEYAREVTVLFDDNRTVVYPFGLLEELVLAYAITVHKSQGSEYPAVVLPLLGGPQVLMNRNLLYTAVTRAKQCVVIVGSGNTLGNMIQNIDTRKRYTSLALRIRELSDTFDEEKSER